MDQAQKRSVRPGPPVSRPPARTAALVAVSVLLMLAVLATSAWIRAYGGEEVAVVRALHRIAASAVALLVTVLAVFAWRQSQLVGACTAAFAIMLALSAVGWIAGTAPPPLAAFFNQAGGLALTALLARIWVRSAHADAVRSPLLVAASALALAQGAFGAALAAFLPEAPPLVLIVHAACGLAAAALVAALGGALALFAALAAPIAGLAAALPIAPALAQVAHALSAGVLVAASAAHAGARGRA